LWGFATALLLQAIIQQLTPVAIMFLLREMPAAVTVKNEDNFTPTSSQNNLRVTSFKASIQH